MIIFINILILLFVILSSFLSQISWPSITVISLFTDIDTYTWESLVIWLSLYSCYLAILIEESYIRKNNIKFSFFRWIWIFLFILIVINIIPLYIAWWDSLSIIMLPLITIPFLFYLLIRKKFNNFFMLLYNHILNYYLICFFIILIFLLSLFVYNYSFWLFS